MTVSSRLLVVVFPDWPLAALSGGVLAARGSGDTGWTHADGAPVAVLDGQRVVASSRAAREQGVVRGQHRRQAQSVCPSLVFCERDHAVEHRAFEVVIETLEHFSPEVIMRMPGWVGLVTRGPARYFGGETRLLAAVDTALFEGPIGTTPSGEWRIGIADGIFAATLAAEAGLVVPAGGSASFLAPQSVTALGNPDLADLLIRLGITTIGEFATLDEVSVSSRFGAEGLRAHELARGLAVEEPVGRPLPPESAVGTQFEPPTDRLDSVAFAARSLAEELCGHLAEGGLTCGMIEITVGLSDDRQFVRLWSHDGPWSPLLVAERLRWQIEAWLTPSSGVHPERSAEAPETTDGVVGVVSVRLEAREITVERGDQLELWGRPSIDEERLARACARVQGMLGNDSVLRPRLVGGRGPGEQIRLTPFGDPPPADPPRSPWPGRLPPPNPAVIAADPVAITLLDESGRSVGVDGRGALSAPPVWCEGGGKERLPVVCWAGPWPTEERWWDRRTRRRRARLQIVTGSGEALLLVLDRGAWSVEGRYD